MRQKKRNQCHDRDNEEYYVQAEYYGLACQAKDEGYSLKHSQVLGKSLRLSRTEMRAVELESYWIAHLRDRKGFLVYRFCDRASLEGDYYRMWQRQ